MQPPRNEMQLFELLSRTIKELERIEDDSTTLNFVSRRLGNIVKHMKDLRDDLQPRGGVNGSSHSADLRPRPSIGQSA
jgi:hypothetical protein